MAAHEPIDPRVRLAISQWPDDAPRGAVSTFCTEHGISRKSFYELRKRARIEGPAAVLEPRSRRPRSSPSTLTVLATLYWAASQLDLPTLADGGYDGAGIGVFTPVKQPADGRELDLDTCTYNALLRGLRCLGERGFALLVGRWRALRHITTSPRKIFLGNRAEARVSIVPGQWSLPRAVNRLHRDVLAPLGFERRGNQCERADNGLIREIRFSRPRWGDPATKGFQVLLCVGVAGLPEPLTEFRRDALWTHLCPAPAPVVTGPLTVPIGGYPLPSADEQLPAELIRDVAGPAAEFLCRATDLRSFVEWATEVRAAAGSWRVFPLVYPGGSAPLQAAALAAAVAGDGQEAERLAGLVVEEEDDPGELRDFQAELLRVLSTAETGV